MPNKNKAKHKAKSSKRKLAPSTYKTFKLSKKIKQPKPPLPGSFRLFWRALKFLKTHWKIFGGISLIYFVFTIVVVKGLSVSSGITDIKVFLDEFVTGPNSKIASSVTLFTVLLGNINTSAGEAANVYQTTFFIIFSLAYVWALRRKMADPKDKLRVRDAFYKGLYPIAPVFLVLVVIGLQLIPLFLASGIYSLVFGLGLAATGVEQFLWLLLVFLMCLLSLYLISSSIIALYVATLPDVTPMSALRSARELVRYRRWMVMRKVFALPIIMLIAAALLVIPTIIISPVVAEWLFLVLVTLSLPVAHSYLYNLYRELL